MQIRYQLPDTVLTYRDVARELSRKVGVKVGLGTVHRLARGGEPQTPRLRRALGLPVYEKLPVCAVCGVVHVGRCPRRLPRKIASWPVKVLARAIRERA